MKIKFTFKSHFNFFKSKGKKKSNNNTTKNNQKCIFIKNIVIFIIFSKIFFKNTKISTLFLKSIKKNNLSLLKAPSRHKRFFHHIFYEYFIFKIFFNYNVIFNIKSIRDNIKKDLFFIKNNLNNSNIIIFKNLFTIFNKIGSNTLNSSKFSVSFFQKNKQKNIINTLFIL